MYRILKDGAGDVHLAWASVAKCPSNIDPRIRATMAKRRVHDYPAMTEADLRDLAREAHGRERDARYAKGRRSWKSAWKDAEAELVRRGLQV